MDNSSVSTWFIFLWLSSLSGSFLLLINYLTVFFVQNSNLIEIRAENFIGMQNLIYLNLDHNKLISNAEKNWWFKPRKTIKTKNLRHKFHWHWDLIIFQENRNKSISCKGSWKSIKTNFNLNRLPWFYTTTVSIGRKYIFVTGKDFHVNLLMICYWLKCNYFRLLQIILRAWEDERQMTYALLFPFHDLFYRCIIFHWIHVSLSVPSSDLHLLLKV